jgi:hypothetical protein
MVEGVAQPVIPYREKLQEQDPRSRMLSDITEGQDGGVHVPDFDDFDLDGLPFEQTYTPQGSILVPYDEPTHSAVAQSVSLTNPEQPATIPNITPTTT